MEVVAKHAVHVFSAARLILDAGCGDGFDLAWLANRFPAAEVVGLDLSEGIYVARRRTASAPNAHLIRGTVLRPPFRPHSFDLVYSYGVLHHTPEPAAAFAALAAVATPGGWIAVYVYADLQEEPLVRLALIPISAVRFASRRLPPTVLVTLARMLSPFVFLTFGLSAQLLSVMGRHSAVVRVPFHWVRHPQEAWPDLFDRFGAEYEWRHSAEQVRTWFAREGFEDVTVTRIHDRRGWLGWGRRRLGAQTVWSFDAPSL